MLPVLYITTETLKLLIIFKKYLYIFKNKKANLQKETIHNICQTQIFEGIYNKYSKDLHDFLYYKYGSQINPDDKAQEAFIKLWDNCKSVTLAKAKSFLFTVANNLVLNDIKHQKVVLNYQKKSQKTHTNETPEFLFEESEFLESYKKALASLNEDQRVAFLLNKVEGKKHAEIAEQLGVTKKVVEYRIYSAFSKLKEVLENFNIK
ncbi:RNA polymerase subunit sigma-70 [Algibacter marinivivus]|uniref:RNA polymerase subunit sigma-70 n=1 Tax=Algibacter marinivivus TaxID=2100723 RepID=A0A2U2X5X5_9FLAO|nr:RNA polymerase subunit sigma-70 [Algibacter marinivivus]